MTFIVLGHVSRYSDGLLMEGRRSTPSRDKKFYSTLQRPEWLWNPPSFLANAYRCLFPGGGEAARA
jgi:hypothetical protein